jgi:hypothetical protein
MRPPIGIRLFNIRSVKKVPCGTELIFDDSVNGQRKHWVSYMIDSSDERSDNDSVFKPALAAVMLILAGLSLMVLNNRLDMVAPAQAAIVAQR